MWQRQLLGTEILLGLKKVLDGDINAQLCEYTETQSTVYFKMANLLYVNYI